jgi:hypothetical protein
VTPPASRATPGGRALLDLQAKAKAERRPTDELLVLYLLEAFLRRLSASPHRERFVLKGGVLLAAFGDRRPTTDIVFQARGLDNDAAATLAVVCSIASLPAEDGVVFDTASAISEAIRDDDAYEGIRVRMTASVDRAKPRFAVDISVGDPIEPGPQEVLLPTLLGQPPVSLLGYPLPMVLAEKIVTALERGTANTRWRDFADVWTLSRRHDCAGAELQTALQTVAEHRGADLVPLLPALDDFALLAQSRWRAWRSRQNLPFPVPEQFGDLLIDVDRFAAPALTQVAHRMTWRSADERWA